MQGQRNDNYFLCESGFVLDVFSEITFDDKTNKAVQELPWGKINDKPAAVIDSIQDIVSLDQQLCNSS